MAGIMLAVTGVRAKRMAIPPKPRKKGASEFIGLGGQHIDRDTVKNRLAERDARIAADNRSPAEIFLGDPPRNQSALTRRNCFQRHQ